MGWEVRGDVERGGEGEGVGVRGLVVEEEAVEGAVDAVVYVVYIK